METVGGGSVAMPKRWGEERSINPGPQKVGKLISIFHFAYLAEVFVIPSKVAHPVLLLIKLYATPSVDK